MSSYNDKLKELRKQIHEQERIQSILKDLWIQHSESSKKIDGLKNIAQREQQDVERLEGFTFASFFAKIKGDFDNKLSKEQEESHIAAVKYKMALDEHAEIEKDIFEYDKKLREYNDCHRKYDELFSQKYAALKQSDMPETAEIITIERACYEYELQLREIAEAISAGKNARAIAESISQLLDSAEDWGTYDLIAGGTFSSVIKHDKLDTAQELVVHLQSALRRFRTELADIDVRSDIRVNIDGFLRFADIFFDSFVADYKVLKEIQSSKSRVREIKTKIDSVIHRLEDLKTQYENQIKNYKGRIGTLVLDANL